MVKNLKDLMSRFKDEAACREFLVQQRWNGTPECPSCGCRKSYKIENGKRFKCANRECYKKYSVTVGTIFEASNIPLTTWFTAMYLITAHKKGISSVQLSKDLGVTQKTAWFILHRIRESLREKSSVLLQGEVQVDEVYLGGLEKNKHANKKAKDAQQASANKMSVIGVIETKGRVVAQTMNWVTRRNTEKFILANVDRSAVLVTDGFSIYEKVGKKYNHIIVNHDEGKFKNGRHHTNSIENFWSVLQRGIYGIYHIVSPWHLQRYLDEFVYRFNSRNLSDGFRWLLSLHQIEGRLTYKELVYGQIKENQEDSDFQAIETGE